MEPTGPTVRLTGMEEDSFDRMLRDTFELIRWDMELRETGVDWPDYPLD